MNNISTQHIIHYDDKNATTLTPSFDISKNERYKILHIEVQNLVKGFDEEKSRSAYLVKLMSETYLAYIEQQERWNRGEHYYNPEHPDEPEEPIEFETDDMRPETLYIIPDDDEIKKKVEDLIKRYVPDWSKRIFFQHVNRDYLYT